MLRITQIDFSNSLSPELKAIYRPGNWILSPKLLDFHKYRFTVFICNSIVKNSDSIDSIVKELERDRELQRVGHYLRDAGIATIVAIPIFSGEHPIESESGLGHLEWIPFLLKSGKLIEQGEFFSGWKTGGRATIKERKWKDKTVSRFNNLSFADRESLFLNEHFYTDYIKKQLKLVINHKDGSKDEAPLNHTMNETQIKWFKSGSALNLIARENQ